MSDHDDDDDGYRVGPGRPPREHQFKKGKSGNPGGKKEGTRNFSTVLWSELGNLITMAGSDKQITKLEGLVKTEINKALKGDLRALNRALNRAERHSERDNGPPSEEETSDEDHAILRRALGRKA